MQIQPDQVTASLNGIVFGGVDQFGVDWTIDDAGIDGWSATKPTTRAQQRSRRSGSLLGSAFASGRNVSFSGMIFAPSADALRDAIDRLNAAVTLSDSKLFVTEASVTRYAWMRQGDDVITKHLMPTIATYSIQLTGKDWRKFGTDVSDRTRLPSTTGGLVINATTYAWTGAANASPSTMSVGGVLQRTNLASDPRATASSIAAGKVGWASRWFGSGGSGNNSSVTGATDGPFGVTSYQRKTWTAVGSGVQDVAWTHMNGSTNGFPVTPGAQYSLASYIRGSRTQPSRDGSNGMVLQWLDASGASLSQSFGPSDGPITAGQWVRYGVAATAPAGAAYAVAYTQVYLSTSSWSVGDTLDGTALLFEQTGAVGSYFDGSFASAGGLVVAPTWYGWTGAADSSASTENSPSGSRTNLSRNPRFGGGYLDWLRSWNGQSAADSVIDATTFGPFGGSALKVTPTKAGSGVEWQPPVAAGVAVYPSIYVKGGSNLVAKMYGGPNGVLMVASGSPVNGWQRYTSPTAVSTSAGSFYIDVYGDAGVPFWIANTMISSALGAYFDGATPTVGGLTIDAVTVTGQVSLTNPGNDTGPLRLRIDGPCTGPVVTHVGTGDRLVFSSSLVLAAGEWLDIDMEKHQVYANGQSSRAGYITARGWFGFDPGQNTFAFTAAQYNAASQLTVAGTPAWR